MFAEPRMDGGGRRGVTFDGAMGMGGGVGFQPGDERKLAVWEQSFFTADMCEALVHTHDNSAYGEYAPFLKAILEQLLEKSLPDEARTGLIKFIQALSRSENLFRRRQHHLMWHIPFHLSRIVDEICKQLHSSSVGDVHIFPFECSSSSICVVHHERQGNFSLGVVNIDPNSTDYHGFSAERPPKILMQTILEVKNIPKAKITSEAFWACDLLSAVADDIVIYTHFLPWLNGKTHAEILEETTTNYSTGSKSDGGNLWKAFIHAMKYTMIKAGAPREDIRAIRFLIKQKLLTAVQHDLDTLEAIPYSTRLILRAAVENAAMALTRNQKNITEDDFNNTRKMIDGVNEKIDKLPCPDEATTQPPPELNLTENWDKAANLDLNPFCEVFRRLENVEDFIGTAVEQPRYVPVNLFRVAAEVKNFDEALLLLDELIRVCTRITTQMDVVKNSGFIISALMTQVFTSILPTPLGPKSRQTRSCLWDAKINYGQQMHCMRRLWQCAEFFIWASFAGKTTKEYDAQRIVVLGAIATLSDAVIRILAHDHPSLISQHLRGYKKKSAYGIGCGKFATQTENCVIVYPQLCFTRAGILDYHQEIAEDIPSTNVMWNWEDGWAFCKATTSFIRQVCVLEGFSTHNVMHYFSMERTGQKCVLGKYWEEYKYHRDCYILWKWMMAPKQKMPTCRNCQTCKPSNPSVEANYGNHKLQVQYMHKDVYCRAMQLRWPSFAIPSKFTAPFEAGSEDDILHIKNLPTFDDVMGQRDSELLLSYLTTPYIRIPLVMQFFATEDRVSCLGNDVMKDLFEAVLFEPAKFLPRPLQGKVPAQVPSESAEYIATPYGVMLNELQFSPDGVVAPLLRMVKLAKEMDAGTVHNQSVVDIILFLVRVTARIESYITLALEMAAKPEEDQPRGVRFEPSVVLALKDGQSTIRDTVMSTLLQMMESWVNEVMEGVVKNAEKSADIDEATRTAAKLHSHILLLMRNVPLDSYDANLVSLAMSSTIFMTTRHTWNNDSLDVPEAELFDVLQIHRRALVKWLSTANKKDLSWVLDSVVRVATSTGTRLEGNPFDWGFVAGEDCVGRFTRVDPDTLNRDSFDSKSGELMKSLYSAFKLTTVPEGMVCINEGLQDVEVNLHILSLTFKAAHLVALPSEIAGMEDVRTIFAPKLNYNEALLSTMQCAIIQDAEHRRWVRLVGQEHDIQYWKTADLRVPLPADAMRFYPDDLTPNEEWIFKIVEPIRKAFFVRSSWQPPIFLLLPEVKLTDNQCVVVLSAVCSKTGKKLKEIVALRDHNSCQVYELFSIGRRFYRRIVFSSDVHYSLCQFQPDIADRRNTWPGWQRHAGGTVNADDVSEQDDSVVILRHPTHPENLSKATETFIPSRILSGLIPQALLDTHNFWQDPDDNIRGYPTEKNAMHILWGHWKETDFTQIAGDTKMVSFKLIRFSRARSAPKVSEKAILKSQKLTHTDALEEELERMRTASTEDLTAEDEEDPDHDLSEGMFREATTMYTPNKESATVEDYNLLLVNLLYAPKDSPLHSLACVFARLELLSHVLCWTTKVDYDPAVDPSITLDLIYLPRLKMSFSARIDSDGTTRLYSLDHAHLFISNLRPKLVCTLLQGIPHSVLLADLNDGLNILVPSLDIVRPRISNAPFSTELVVNRANKDWYKKLDTRYYLYPIHVSLSFLFTPTLASALYLLGLRYLHCEYEEVFKLASTIGTDVEFTAEEKQNFNLLRFDDERPEAHACRSKIGLLVADSPVMLCWYLPTSTAKMIHKSNSISLSCQLSESEERRLLYIATQILKKIAVIHEVTKMKDVKSETLDTVLSRIIKSQPMMDGSASERKHIKNLFEKCRVRLRETMNLRSTNAEIQRLLQTWNSYRRYYEFSTFRKCLIANRSAYLEAEAVSIEQGGKPVKATYVVPSIGKDELWNYFKDFNALSVKVPESQSKQKNDEQRPVNMSGIYDYFYCGTTVRKAGMCKCKDCGEECGDETGCPCPSCERFNKANLDKLRYVPTGISSSSSRMISFYDVFSWIESLLSEDSSTRDSEESVPVEQRIFSSRCRKVTMRDETNGFLRYYEMLTGTTKVRIGSGDSAKDLAQLLFPLCHEARKTECAFGHLMHFMLNNQHTWSKLPKYNRTSKQNFDSRMNTLYNGIISQAAQNSRVPAEPPLVPKRPTSFDVEVVGRPNTRHNPETPIRSTRVLPNLANTDCSKRIWKPTKLEYLDIEKDSEGKVKEDLTMDDEIRADLRLQPLRVAIPAGVVVFLSRAEMKASKIDPKLQFDLHKHDAAKTTVAKSMINRLEQDMDDFAKAENEAKFPKFNGLHGEHEVRNVVVARGDKMAAVKKNLNELADNLSKMKEADAKFTDSAFTVLERTANAMHVPKGADETAAHLMHLRRVARQEAVLVLSYMISCLTSTVAEADWRQLNPFLTQENCDAIISLIISSVLRANRVGHANRASETAKELLAMLTKAENPPPHLDEQNLNNYREALVTSIMQKADALSGILATKRVYLAEDFSFDPRFLIFEFTWNLVLRSRQKILINEMYASIMDNTSIVKQMIMGAGKTTVVGPLLALMLADSKNLVIQVVPPALLDFTRTILRGTFSCVIQKQIFCFSCDRASDVDSEVLSKFLHAKQSRGIVVTTPSSIKSIFLKYIEGLDRIEDTSRPQLPGLEHEVKDLGEVLKLWKDSVLIMDEVDMLLHPLKSELNFPIGAKHDIDFAPMRWKLPIHLMDALFYFNTKRISMSMKENPDAIKMLGEIADIIRKGLSQNALQSTPHLTLLNLDFYDHEIKVPMTKWLMLLLKSHHFAGLTEEETIRYITKRPSLEVDPALNEKVQSLEKDHIKTLNLSFEWINSFLPHCLQKIDRVSFGIMNADDMKRARDEHPNMPRSRFVTSIPFVGKDLPSQSSEFAHPDVVIGLTVLAYRYEGLRKTDFVEIMRQIHAAVEKEVGRFHQRRTNLLYNKWVAASGGRLLQSFSYNEQNREDDEIGMQPSESMGMILSHTSAHDDEDAGKKKGQGDVLPLKLMKQANEDESDKLFKLFRRTPEVIHWYLCETIFPEYMRHQKSKLSASGQELGGNMLFKRRIGFSGTPSDLLPSELGKCEYEPGTDGKLVHTLTSPAVMNHTIAENGWTVRSLLDWMANASPPFHALIDTGALITGMSNLQVAQYLLKHGLSQMEGVVFLDDMDRKMILVRATGRVLKLAECGIPATKRFAFYDQVHTTGMDIQHTPNAEAVCTLGKDMTFRDFAQGAYRMRGIAQGQRIHLLIIPEVHDLIKRVLKSMRREGGKSNILNDVTAWLLVNSVRSEHTQHNQLCIQSICNVWRKEAHQQLMTASNDGKFAIGQKITADLLAALTVYREGVDYEVPQLVPQPQMFSETIQQRVDDHSKFVVTDEGKAVVKAITDQTKREDEVDNPVIDVQMVQEQEEEREAVVEKEKEQEIEMEKFVDLAYSRDEEMPVPWAVNALRDFNRSVQFYKLKDFHLYKRRPLAFPENLMLSRNFFNPKWSGHRRIKNVVCALEWIPDTSTVKELEKAFEDYGSVEEGKALKDLTSTVDLLTGHQGPMNTALLYDFISIAMGTPEWGQGDSDRLNEAKHAETIHRLLAGNFLRREESNRYTVALSLCEAETLRRVIHQRVLAKEAFIPDSKVQIALTIVPSSNAVLDQTRGFVEARAKFQRYRAYQCMRFFDSDLHYTEHDVNYLLRSVHASPEKSRQAFFLQILACRRRARQRWEKTPVSLLFNMPTPYTLLHQKTIGLCLRRELDNRQLHLGDAFMAMNSSSSGQLSPDELWGGLKWCRLDVAANDVLDFIQVADTHHDGTIQYADFLAMLTGSREIDDDEGQTKDDVANKKLPTIAPYGGDELKDLRATAIAARRKDEQDASKEMESEDKRVREEIEQEAMREELGLIQTCTNPLLGDENLHFTMEDKDVPKLAKYFGIVKPREFVPDFEEEKFFTFNNSGQMQMTTRSIKLLTDNALMSKYALTVEFCLPRPKKSNGKESKQAMLEMLEDEGEAIRLFSVPTNFWELRKGQRVQIGGPANNSDDDDDDDDTDYDEDSEDYYDDEDDDEDNDAKDAHWVYSTTDRDKKNRVARMHIGDEVKEEVGERMYTSAGSVSTEWMKVTCGKLTGWCIFDEGGLCHWQRYETTFELTNEGAINVDYNRMNPEQLVPTVFEEEKVEESDDDSQDDWWYDYRWADQEQDEDDDEEEEEEDNGFDMGDLTDLAAALKKKKELKQGDRVTRNPECWEGHGNDDGGEGTTGKVVKVDENTVQVQWPNGNKKQYAWGAGGKFELIKTGSADDDDDLGRDVGMDDQHGPLLKKKGKQRCGQCSQNVGIDSAWFRCNQCTNFNLCKKCFKNMDHQEHEFTDMVALSEFLKSSEVVRGSLVRIKPGTTPQRWGDAPRDGTPGIVMDLDDEQNSITVNFNDEPWYGLQPEVEVVHPKYEQYATSWLGLVFNVTPACDRMTAPALTAVIDQSFIIPEVIGKYKVGERVKAKWKGRNAYPGTIRAVLPKKTYAVDFDDGDHEPKAKEEEIELMPFMKGMKVRLKRPEKGGSSNLPKGVTGGMMAEVMRVMQYSGMKIRIQLQVRNGMKRTHCYVFDDQIELLGLGKFFIQREQDENPLPLPNSSTIMLEKGFTDGILPKSISIQAQHFSVNFVDMKLTNLKTKEELKLIRQPEEPWVKRREELHFDDAKWHTLSILVDGNEDIIALCDGKKILVEYLGPNDCVDEEDEEDEEAEEKEEKDEEGGEAGEKVELNENQEWAAENKVPSILNAMAEHLVTDKPEDPVGSLAKFLETTDKDTLLQSGMPEAGETKTTDMMGDDEEEEDEEEEDDEEGEEDEEDEEDEADEDQYDDKEEEEKPSLLETGEGKPATAGGDKKKEEKAEADEDGEVGGWDKGEDSDDDDSDMDSSSSEESKARVEGLPELKRRPTDILTLDLRNGITVMKFEGTGAGNTGKFGATFPQRRVAGTGLNWGKECTEEKLIEHFAKLDVRKRWRCVHCGTQSSRLEDNCTDCSKPRVEVTSTENKKVKMRSANPRSKEAQDIRKKVHAKLRQKYQDELDKMDNMDGYSLLL